MWDSFITQNYEPISLLLCCILVHSIYVLPLLHGSFWTSAAASGEYIILIVVENWANQELRFIGLVVWVVLNSIAKNGKVRGQNYVLTSSFMSSRPNTQPHS